MAKKDDDGSPPLKKRKTPGGAGYPSLPATANVGLLTLFCVGCNHASKGRPPKSAKAKAALGDDDAAADGMSVDGDAAGAAAVAAEFPREKLLPYLRELELDAFEVPVVLPFACPDRPPDWLTPPATASS